MKKTIILCAAIPLLLAGCNTMEGMGTDMEHGGQDLHNAAQNEKAKMNDTDNTNDNGTYNNNNGSNNY